MTVHLEDFLLRSECNSPKKVRIIYGIRAVKGHSLIYEASVECSLDTLMF